jgi:multidrug efflux pump subunit AcrA (membrane-fusion protein)
MKRTIIIIAALAVLLLGWRVLGREPVKRPAATPASAPREVTIPVTAAAVGRGEMTHTLLLTGALRTDEDVRLSSKVTGRVASVSIREGDRVRAGQLLIQLDPGELQAKVNKSAAALQAARARLSQTRHGAVVKDATASADLERAQANLAAAKLHLSQTRSQAGMADTTAQSDIQSADSRLKWANQRLQMLKEGARRQERRQAEFSVVQAKATLEDARARYERRKQLATQGAIASEDADAAERQFRVAEAQYQSAQEQLALVEEGSRSQEIRMAEEEVTQAEESLRQAKSNQAKRKISEEDVSTAETAVRQAHAQLDVARAGTIQSKLTQDDIRNAEAAVAQAAADLAYDETQLAYTRIVSPVTGVVIARSVNPGEAVGTSAILLRIVSPGSAYFEGQVPEKDLPQLRVGQTVRTTVDSLPGRTFQGAVRQIIPVADTGSRAFRVRVRVSSPDGMLPVGGFARGTVLVSQKRDVVVVPKEAVMSEAGDNFVYLVRGGRARRQLVVVGLTDSQRAEITAGLQPGQTIITSGSSAVTDGAAVHVTGGERAAALP